MPKNKQFLHMLEEPATRRLLERIESAILTDMRKEEARELREELYFTIDEKGNDASLTEKGCETLSPNDPEMPMFSPTSFQPWPRSMAILRSPMSGNSRNDRSCRISLRTVANASTTWTS